jgi:hypothetical protein
MGSPPKCVVVHYAPSATWLFTVELVNLPMQLAPLTTQHGRGICVEDVNLSLPSFGGRLSSRVEQVYTQTNLAHNAPKEQTWQSMLTPPNSN